MQRLLTSGALPSKKQQELLAITEALDPLYARPELTAAQIFRELERLYPGALSTYASANLTARRSEGAGAPAGNL